MFICTGITPSVAVDTIQQSSIPISNGKTLYVGGTGPGNYTKIQDAIDNASDGDTVFVYDESSPYYEYNILIKKSINLIGEDRNTTTIDGNASGDIFNITADRVTISQFMIQNTSRYNIALKILSDSNSIINNIIWKNWYGIYFDNSNKNTIKGNNISKNQYGIMTEYSHNNCIINNTLTSNNYYGIRTRISNNNTIMNNNIILNNLSGILTYRSNLNTISYNKMEANYYADMHLMNSEYNIIKCNNISNSRDGIRLQQCYNNIILGNNIFSYLHPYGNGLVIYWESTDNIIYHNNFINNTEHAHDENSNNWNNSYPLGGNYWDDYDGVDNFSGPNQDIPGSDGIGDTPYPIPMGSNEDRYPLMNPWDNTPPEPPIIDGPRIVKIGEDNEFTFSAVDTDGDEVSYLIKWGDGDTTDWTDFQASGPPGYTESHSWDTEGEYIIQAKAKDINDDESEWTVIIVDIPRTKAVYHPMLLRFLERFPSLERLLNIIF